MALNIGNLVVSKMKEKRMSRLQLANSLGMVRQNIPDLLKRKSMQTDLLEKIGEVMQYDFFQDCCKVKREQMMKERAALENKLQEAQNEIKTLNRIIEVLKEKK